MLQGKMLTMKTLFHVVIITFTLSEISTTPVIQKDSSNLQSIKYSTNRKKPIIPDAAATIEQVQKILQEDPTLPRLTKGEIEDLFEQVTREEYEKSLQLGDVHRANNMRALMLVLPYNTDNTTDEALQELYTRPPITKVIDSYSSPQPHKFQTAASVPSGKVEIVEVGNMAATTYKPYFRLKEKTNANPTTYHPSKPILKAYETTTVQVPVPVSSLPLLPDIEEDKNKVTRYSSSYNANDADWSLLEGEFNNRIHFNKKFSPMPDLTGIFKTMGMDEVPKRFKLGAYQHPAKPAISSSIEQSSFGNIDIADFTRTLPPRSHIEAYSEFKPLNIGEEIRIKPDIENYLQRFGIVNRKRKQIKPEDSGDVDIDVKVKPKEEAMRRIDTDILDSQPTEKNEKELAQLSKLLNNLQELERLNVSLPVNMLKTVNMSNGVLAKGPDPVTADEESRKNDLKRQSAAESASDSELDVTEGDTKTSSKEDDEEPANTTKESSNGSLTDLEDSFGGPDPITEDPSPPPKKNGFYFLADWNSFLEVGEAGNDQVVVRFDPKIGDPRRFLNVKVP